MLGFLLLYWIGKSFYDLAEIHSKNNWLFAILGIVSFYLGEFLGGIVVVLFLSFVLVQPIDDVNDFLLGLMTVPFGLLVCWGFHVFLKNHWEQEPMLINDEVLDDGFLG